jgi:hypothetical protein
LFVSPFVLVFAASSFPESREGGDRPVESVAAFQNLELPDGSRRARPDAADRAKAIMAQVGVTGEVGFTSRQRTAASRSRCRDRDSASDRRRSRVAHGNRVAQETGVGGIRLPAQDARPHNVAIRGNWIATQIWRWFADATVYLLLFISIAASTSGGRSKPSGKSDSPLPRLAPSPFSVSSMRLSGRGFESWNRKLHYYLGLYFLFFLWLFSVTGLMLNHQQWFRGINQRDETPYETPIATPAGTTVLERTHDVMQQLALAGEIDWPTSQPVGHLDFSVSRPTESAQVRVDLNAKTAYVRHFANNKRLAFQVFHTFSGSRFAQPGSRRDWIVTSIWVWAMDALAVGLLAMVLGSYYMWWRLKKRKTLGVIVLSAGVASCVALLAR